MNVGNQGQTQQEASPLLAPIKFLLASPILDLLVSTSLLMTC